MTERIHKVIARSGFVSLRRAEQLIRSGRVTVDGNRATIGQRVDPDRVEIAVDGVTLPVRADLEYYVVYKPVGVVSTAADTHGRTTVVDLVPDAGRVYPVGRLDADSEGLLILTNDGELTNRLTHPRYGVEKTYTVLAYGNVTEAALRRLTSGVDLDDGPATALRASLVDRRPDRTLVEVVMGEGRKREVRRMFDAIGHPVRRLVRTAIGPLRDSRLAPGDARRLTIEEVRSLYATASPAWEDAGGASNASDE